MKKPLLLTLVILSSHFLTLSAQNPCLYGMTYGGDNIFRYDLATNKDSVLYNFGYSNGYEPFGSLIKASNGLLYGMTGYGGSHNCGTAFSFDPTTNQFNLIIDFNGPNGAGPVGSLLQASNGFLYGMTQSGGDSSFGVLFRYDPVTNNDTVLHSFHKSTGKYPFGSLIQASDGLLYGTTSTGTDIAGVIFSFNPVSNVYTCIKGVDSVGFYPYGGLMQASNGLIYGTTYEGGHINAGVMYSFNIVSHALKYLFDFRDSNGSFPYYGNLVQDKNGLIYGMTKMGGSSPYSLGVLYCYNPVTGKDSVVLNFNGTNGANPYGGLIQDSNGVIYGMTYGYGVWPGNLFSYNPATGKDTVLCNLGQPYGNVLLSTYTPVITKVPALQNKEQQKVNIYPNPNKGVFTLQMSAEKQNTERLVEIYNMLGEKVYSQPFSIEHSILNIDVSSQPTGIYLYRVIGADGKEMGSGKFIIQ